MGLNSCVFTEISPNTITNSKSKGAIVASVDKKWVTLRDQIDISMTSEVDNRIIIGAVIVIEHIEVNERQNQH